MYIIYLENLINEIKNLGYFNNHMEIYIKEACRTCQKLV